MRQIRLVWEGYVHFLDSLCPNIDCPKIGQSLKWIT